MADVPEAMLTPHATREILRESASWADVGAIAESWFEDDQQVASLVAGARGRRKTKLADYLLQSIFARRRDKWAEHFLWTALWIRETPGEADPPWPRFAILARALADGRDLAEISVVHDIAMRTVAALTRPSAVYDR